MINMSFCSVTGECLSFMLPAAPSRTGRHHSGTTSLRYFERWKIVVELLQKDATSDKKEEKNTTRSSNA